MSPCVCFNNDMYYFTTTNNMTYYFNGHMMNTTNMYIINDKGFSMTSLKNKLFLLLSYQNRLSVAFFFLGEYFFFFGWSIFFWGKI